MDVKAIILVGGNTPPREQLAGVPIAFLDVLGEPVVLQLLNRLEHFGVSAAAVVTDFAVSRSPVARSAFRPGLRSVEAKGHHFWRAIEYVFNDFAQSGSELVLVVRLGSYAEIDYEDLVQFHLDKQCRISSVSGPDGTPVDTFVISASRRNDAAYLFRHELREMRTGCEEFFHRGYTNPLRNAGDLRLLALDSFAGLTSISPRGEQIKPGVWVGENAKIHRNARVLAPCFVGANAKIRASALLTRGSVVEHHVAVDCGTVVENSTVLPLSMIGAGLDITNSVLGFSRIWSLKRNIEVPIEDPRLVGMLQNTRRRVVSNAARLALFLPKVLSQAVLGRTSKPEPAVAESVRRPAAALKNADPATQESLSPASDLISARRYGNQ
jgi:carbonic anhydrase/acetyltransferase-like protein (isoleucine patch superfamily)